MLALLCALAGTSCGGEAEDGADATVGQGVSPGAPEEVRAMLRASAGSWNAGDLEGFLDDYTNRDDLTFTGASGVRRGKDAIRQSYHDAYWAPGTRRDSLRFDSLEVRMLGTDHALVLGRYVLYRPAPGEGGEAADSVTGTGPFTLVLRREDGAWRILHDHSS